MSNGQLHDDKLFQGLHDRLSDYEAPYDGADWDAMSRSLDKLPKTNQFRWKFSLNTIGIMLGIVGLTVLGVVIAQGNGKPSPPAENRNVTTSNAPEQKKAPVATTNPNAAAIAPVTSVAVNDVMATNPVQQINSQKDLTQPRERKSTFDNPFRFGDQIDPVKGAIYSTKEDPALVKGHKNMKKPDTLFDYDPATGKLTPIKVGKDSSSSPQELKQDSVPATPVQTNLDPAAPTEGQRIGFDND